MGGRGCHQRKAVSKGQSQGELIRQGEDVEESPRPATAPSQLEVDPAAWEDQGGVVSPTVLLVGGLDQHTGVSSHLLHLLPPSLPLSTQVAHHTTPRVLVARAGVIKTGEQSNIITQHQTVITTHYTITQHTTISLNTQQYHSTHNNITQHTTISLNAQQYHSLFNIQQKNQLHATHIMEQTTNSLYLNGLVETVESSAQDTRMKAASG